jgi:hypothetical protein
LASLLKLSNAFDAIAMTWRKGQKRVYARMVKYGTYQQVNRSKKMLVKHMSDTSRLNGGYLPSPGVALAEALTMSINTRCT